MGRSKKGSLLLLEDVRIIRGALIPLHPFKKYFQGFEKVEAVRKIFGSKTEEILDNLKIEISGSRRGYMGVHGDDGHLLVNANWLNSAPDRDLYLDIVHELVHVRQHREGKELFDENYDYVDRPTEIEAYKVAVAEARAIGMSEREIYHYLRMERFTNEEHHKLCSNVGVKIFS